MPPPARPIWPAGCRTGGGNKSAVVRAPALTFSDKDRLQKDWLSQNVGAGIAFPTHRLASSQGFVDASLAGLGWGLNPEPLVADHLARGRLVCLIPNATLDAPLYWQFSRLTAPSLAPLTAAMRYAAAQVLRR